MTEKLYCIHKDDNVATALCEIKAGPCTIIGESQLDAVKISDNIAEGHKAAIRDIAAGEDIIKYGIAIGYATMDITCGNWVHLHNMKSHFDERSSTLDLKTGLSSDIEYE